MTTSTTQHVPDYPQYYGPPITIRLSTKKERDNSYSPNGHKMVEKYVIVNADNPNSIMHTFFMPVTAPNKAEAVFWAERFASKNGRKFIRPDGWEKVVGKLKDD